MKPTAPPLLLLVASGAASCGPEIPRPPPPMVVDVGPAPAAEPPPRPVDPPPVKVAAPPVEEEPVPFHCAGGELIVAGDRPYCVQKTALSFHESERWCVAHGGHLARIGSEEETRALAQALGSPVGFEGAAWMGLALVRGGQWIWSTGAVASFTAWAPGEPNNTGGNEGCGEVYAHSAQWNDLPCDRPIPYLCEARPARPGAAPPRLRCEGTSFRAGGIDYCYERGRPSPWLDAEHACKKQGGTLASFRTAEESAAFRAAINGRFGFERIWIGFTDEGHEGRWTTVSGRTQAYARWRPGEPNNAGGNENCAEWLSPDGGWNDVACDLPRVGVCTPR